MNIDPKKTFLAISTLALPIIALLVFVLASPQSAYAHANCTYAGQEYSEGAQSQNGCSAGYSQVCQSDGTWDSCQRN
jgi:hypothetical protein